MNVLMNGLSSLSGGAVTYLRNLTPLLLEQFARKDAGHRLKILAHEEQRPLLAGLPDEHLCWIAGERPRGYRRVGWERLHLPRIVREQGADVLFTPYQIGFRIPGVRQIVMLRNLEPFFFEAYGYSPAAWVRNQFLRHASTACLKRADRIIAVSGLARDLLVDHLGIGAPKVRTIYHGAPNFGETATDEQALLGGLGIAAPFILSCGSLLPYRRCEDVIAAFEHCAPVLDDGTLLVIAGTGSDTRYEEKIRREIAASAHGHRIRAVGHVAWDSMKALYRHCRVFVTATEIEGCPNIAIEAMTAGCAIVSADRQPLPEMFGGCSLEYQARDVDDLAQRVTSVFRDDSLCRALRSRALERSANFSWERCARETYAALTQ